MQNDYKVILLSAGLGTRLKPLTKILPKCLMPIRGVPILAHWLQKCMDSRINHIYVNTHYKAHIVENFLSTVNNDFDLVVAREPVLLGTAGTVRAAASWINNHSVIIVHADNFSSLKLSSLIAAHEKAKMQGVDITMATFLTDTPKSCGIVKLDDNRVVGFYEKVEDAPGNLANGAVYIFEPNVVKYICENEDIFDISNQIIPKFLGKIGIFNVDNFHIDIGNLKTLRKSQKVTHLLVGDTFDKGIKELGKEFMQIENILKGDVV